MSDTASAIAIFSDLHLGLREDEQHRAFVKELVQLRQQGLRELWLLGDIFDLLVGPYPSWEKQYPLVFAELRNWLQSGARVLYFEGNHDLQLKSWFKDLGIELYEGPVQLERGQQLFYVAHGDEVNQADKTYLRWRAALRSRSFSVLLKTLPSAAGAELVSRVGGALSRISRKRGAQRDKTWPQTELRQLYRHFAETQWRGGSQGVLLGHCHLRDFHLNDGRFYLNLGSWLSHERPYAVWKKPGTDYPETRFCGTMES